MKRTLNLGYSPVLDNLLGTAIETQNGNHKAAARCLAEAVADPDFENQVEQLEDLQETMQDMEDNESDRMYDDSDEDMDMDSEESGYRKGMMRRGRMGHKKGMMRRSYMEDMDSDEDMTGHMDHKEMSSAKRRRVSKASSRKVMARLENLL